MCVCVYTNYMCIHVYLYVFVFINIYNLYISMYVSKN